MSEYQPLPLPPAADATETLETYGLRLVLWTMEHRCTATMSDEQLELAVYAGVRASALAPDAIVADRVSEIRHLLASSLTQRQRDYEDARARLTAMLDPRESYGDPSTDRPNEGPMAPIRPGPKTQPPAPAYALAVPSDNVAF